jgi:hypothetical protein
MATRAHTVPKFYLNGFLAPESMSGPDPYLWFGSLTTGEIKRRSPKNISITRGLYDGPGGLENSNASLEAHLAMIEAAAATAIREFVAAPLSENASPPAEIWRFLAWQAARTPQWIALVSDWANSPEDGSAVPVLEPPPAGMDNIKEKIRNHCIKNPETGERHEVADIAEFEAYRKRGWKWILSLDDQRELIHLQAWYFQIRHFPRLSWVRLNTPSDEWFVTSDRAVAWLAEGHADTPPSALRHPSVLVLAPLTSKTALIGRHGTHQLNVSSREMNCQIALAASAWIAGPTKAVVEAALQDRATR